MGLFGWLKKDYTTKEGDKIVELQNKAKEKVDKEFEHEFPYDINNVSSPVLIIAEKWKNDPKRVKVKRTMGARLHFVELADRKTKFRMGVSRISTLNVSRYSKYPYQYYANTADCVFNNDESNYLLSECKEALETRCNLVQSRYNRLKGYKKVLKENEERKRIQKLFEES